jgi:hypothetical protein
MVTEQQIQQAILLELGSRADVRVWRQNSGMAVPLSDKSGRPVRYGVNGCADISGMVTIDGLGVRLEVEVKSATGRQSPDQKRFEAMIRSRGGVYILARSVDEAVAMLEAEVARIRGGK